jgi:hypothetical protein
MVFTYEKMNLPYEQQVTKILSAKVRKPQKGRWKKLRSLDIA